MSSFGKMGLLLMAFFALSLASCKNGTPTPTPQPPSDESALKLIAEVTDVSVAMLKSFPPQLSISAKGNASSTGWTKPELKPFVYVAPPQDGIYDFNFQALPPSGPAATVMTPIEANYTLNPLPNTLKGVRIHASQNTKEVMLDAK